MNFGDNLRNLRISRGLTQMELAKELATSQSSITAWEVGAREPNFSTISRIANYFHVPISSLMPSSDVLDEDDSMISTHLQSNPKLRLLFDRTKYMSDSDLDAVLGVVAAITKERDG